MTNLSDPIDLKIVHERDVYRQWSLAPQPHFYEIPSYRMEQLKAEIERINRKADKLGVPRVSLKVIATYRKTYKVWDEKNDPFHLAWSEEIVIKLHRVVIEGSAPRLADWTLCAVLQHEDAGNIVRTLPNAPQMPEKYREAKPACDHCQQTRRRNDTYVVFNQNAREFKQVGSNCLGDFTGANDPLKAAAHAERVFEVMRTASEYEDIDFAHARKHSLINAVGYMTHVVAMARSFGFASKAKSDMPTSDRAWQNLLDCWKADRGEKVFPDPIRPTDSDSAEAAAILKWVVEVLGSKHVAARSDYEHNLLMACSVEWITLREIGIIASAYPMYKRFTESQLTKKSLMGSQWQGTLKERRLWTDLICTGVIELAGDRYADVVYINKLEDKDGNQLVWKTSSKRLEQGAVYFGKATVDAHQTYNGIQQTKLTRCDFQRSLS